MFTKVKDLTMLIDGKLEYLENGRANKDKCEENIYNEWLTYITRGLQNNIAELKQRSCNKKLIARYERKVAEALAK